MTRMIRGSVLLAACVALWSCTNDPTADEAGVPFQIVTVPGIVFVQQDASELIGFQLQDELGGSIPESWTINAASPLFTVTFDSTYRPVYNADGTLTLPEAQTEVRATITGTGLGIGSFTVSAGGKTATVTVNVTPGRLYATFAPSNPTPGQTVTMTMPAELRLTPASTITFPGNSNPVSLVIAPDSLSATFISAPTTDTTATVSAVYNPDFPTLAVATYTTVDKVTGTQSGTWNGQLPATITPASSAGSPNGTGSITVTLNAAYAFKTSAPASVFSFPGQTAPIIASISADSTVANLNIAPNIASPLSVTRVTFKGAPQFEYSLVSADSVYTPVITDVPVTMSPLNPLVGDTVTITAGPGFAFSQTSTVAWPLGSTAIIASATTGSNVMKVLPMPGSAGLPTITGVIPASAPAFAITLPASGSALTVQNASIYDGRDDPNTATLLTVPPILTDTLEFYDLFSGPTIDQFYQMSLVSPSTLAVRISWGNTADVDLLFCSGIPFGVPGCDAFYGGFAGATGANPENATVSFNSGLFYIWTNLYAGANPPWLRIRVIRTS